MFGQKLGDNVIQCIIDEPCNTLVAVCSAGTVKKLFKSSYSAWIIFNEKNISFAQMTEKKYLGLCLTFS